jgi:hypothetical protein
METKNDSTQFAGGTLEHTVIFALSSDIQQTDSSYSI